MDEEEGEEEMTQDEIRKIIEDNPGILQSDLYSYVDLNTASINDQVLALHRKREIRREKCKNSNKLYIS